MADFIVNKRFLILAIMLIIAIAFSVCIPFVKINGDLTKYLPKNSQMRKGMIIMDKAFPPLDSFQFDSGQSIRVMFTDLDANKIEEVKAALEKINYVDSVSYDKSENYNKDNHTLFILNMSCEYGSSEEKAIFNALNENFSGFNMIYRNDDSFSAYIPLWIIFIALAIMIVILFAMCGSWFEPILFLAVIGIAVVINMGSNIIFGGTSEITFSIAPVLQLALSMDYSIILMNRYRQERRLSENKLEAMKNALTNSFGAISSSSLTTIVGLLMLCFMSFSIGIDFGLVLAKGVFLSLLCVLTILPTLILLCDKIILKTEKRPLRKLISGRIAEGNSCALSDPDLSALADSENPPAAKKQRRSFFSILANSEYRARYIIIGMFAALFILVCVFQAYTPTNFAVSGSDLIEKVFPKKELIAIVYNNDCETDVDQIVGQLSENKYVSDIISYNEIFGKPYSVDELLLAADELGIDFEIDESLVKAVYYAKLGGPLNPISAGSFARFIYDCAQIESFSKFIPAELQDKIELLNDFSDKEYLILPRSNAFIAQTFDMEERMVAAIIRATITEEKYEESYQASIGEFINMAADMAKRPIFQSQFDEETVAKLVLAQNVVNAIISEKEYSAAETAEIVGLGENIVKLLYLLYASNAHFDSTWKISLHEFADQVFDLSDSLSEFLDDNAKDTLSYIKSQINSGVALLKGDNYSRLILRTTLPKDGDEMKAFFNNLPSALDEADAEYYLIGESAMNYEMEKTFRTESIMITVLTIVAIFTVVALSLRNLVIPAILVAIVQCSIFITVVAMHSTGVYYLALIIVQCILMGATIDYGILFTNYYRESRASMPPKEAVKNAYKGALHAILTSGLILILVTFVIGLLYSGMTSVIVLAISIGALSASALILLVLPALLIVFDKAVMHKISFKKIKPSDSDNNK